MFRILIVDDERIVLNGIRRMIEEDLELTFPMDIVTASNDDRFIDYHERNRYNSLRRAADDGKYRGTKYRKHSGSSGAACFG